MAWIEVCLSVPGDISALAELTLEQLGALSITLEDGEDNPVLEPGPGETPLWPFVQVRGLFEATADRERIMTALRVVPGAGRPDQLHWREVADQDWERAWMDRFQPMKFGHHLWIVPGGMEIPPNPGNVEVQLDPGLAFGTGTHPTTALCLDWLDGMDVTSRTIVDYGCGSGILGIAAAVKGAGRVICVDNDPQALEATLDNAGRNGISGLIECCAPRDFGQRSADIILANILAVPLIELAPLLLRSLNPAGSLVLSGILEEQADTVAAAYQAGLASIDMKAMDGWVRLHGLSS